jgi:hypothetical protein
MSAGFGWSRCLRFAILTSHSLKSMLPYAEQMAGLVGASRFRWSLMGSQATSVRRA